MLPREDLSLFIEEFQGRISVLDGIPGSELFIGVFVSFLCEQGVEYDVFLAL